MLTFIESPSFTQQLAELWPDAEYAAFQQFLAASPERGDVIPGLGGLRKVRWAAKGKGKRGGGAGHLPAARASGYHLPFPRLHERRHHRHQSRAEETSARGGGGNQSAIPTMKKKPIPFNAEDLIRSVEEVRDAVTGRRKLTLRTTNLPKPAPMLTPKDVQRIRARLKVSQSVFAAMLECADGDSNQLGEGAKATIRCRAPVAGDRARASGNAGRGVMLLRVFPPRARSSWPKKTCVPRNSVSESA